MNKRVRSRTAARATAAARGRHPARTAARPDPSVTVKPETAPPEICVYPRGFVYGRGEANPQELSLAGLKIARALAALRAVQGKVLEIGCGGGQYLRALRRQRPELEIYGIDLDPVCVAEAVQVAGTFCCCADAAELPFPKGTFDAVIGFDILEHVAEPAMVLDQAAHVLKRGGRLHLYVPCEANSGTVYVLRGHGVKARWGGHIQQFTTESVLQLIRRAGFTLESVRHSDYWLTQQLDYMFFNRLDKSHHPERLWAAQSLAPGGGLTGFLLRRARHFLSLVTWLEGTLRTGRYGAMGVHVTAVKK
jgi:SAM-dependent methyltransferase